MKCPGEPSPPPGGSPWKKAPGLGLFDLRRPGRGPRRPGGGLNGVDGDGRGGGEEAAG